MNDLSTSGVISDLAPTIVTSPTIRSGTTLLQRLLCSSSNALIYGEECGKDLELFLQIYTAKLTVYSLSRQRSSSGLKRVLGGEVNDWILDLMPEPDGYIEAIGRGCFSGLAYCRDYAVQAGRPVWGIKYPGWTPYFLRLIRQVMPKSRFIIIYRDIVECVRSAKARQSLASEQDVRQFCKLWLDNLTFMLRMKNDPSVLLVRYADLVSEPENVIEGLARFADIQHMRPEVLKHKINTWVDGEGSDISRSRYIEPAALTEAESRIADEAASALTKVSLDMSES